MMVVVLVVMIVVPMASLLVVFIPDYRGPIPTEGIHLRHRLPLVRFRCSMMTLKVVLLMPNMVHARSHMTMLLRPS
uniref:Uncharacterized protein n=1 Tax=Anopheles darlingi TaxID=43151 RepID=A0A2M4D412_ANODA